MNKIYKLLLIDDDECDRMHVKHLLEKAEVPCNIQECEDGITGITAFDIGSFDCVFVDYKLPDKNGIEILEQIIQIDPHASVILMTGMGDEHLAVKAMKAGAVDYIPKNNLTSNTLIKSIRTGTQLQELQKRTKQVEMRLVDTEKQYRSIVESISDIVMQVDKEGTITFANPAIQLLNYRPEEILGKPFESIIEFDKKENLLPQILTCRTGTRATINLEVELKNKVSFDSKDITNRKTVLFSSLGMWDTKKERKSDRIKSKTYIGTQCIIRDISERKHAEVTLKNAHSQLEKKVIERTLELRKSKEEAEKHNNAKSEFLSNMSHELRTPMNAILGFAQLMDESKKDPLPTSHKNRVSQILKSGQHLLELINEVLDLSSIESGKVSVSLQPINIAELTKDISIITRPMAEKYQVKLINEINSHEAIFVQADSTRLRQVLLNLISNAVKYNRKDGSVVLSLRHIDDSLKLQIRDTGIGIPKKKLAYLFEPFDRLGNENSQIEGTGIGLTISKKLIELMKGEISVDSTLGEGTEFTISLPIWNSMDSKVKSLSTS